jgi:hypothetical protein
MINLHNEHQLDIATIEKNTLISPKMK